MSGPEGELITCPLAGDCVYIVGAHVGVSPGRVESVNAPDNLPPLHDVEAVREIMAEWGVDLVVILSYWHPSGREFLFCALRVGGKFYDLKQQQLMLWRRELHRG